MEAIGGVPLWLHIDTDVIDPLYLPAEYKISHGLRPSVLDDFGVSEALREFGVALQEQGELDVHLAIDPDAKAAAPEANVALFRIAQEAVLNALVVNNDMVGRKGHRSPALPHERLLALLGHTT